MGEGRRGRKMEGKIKYWKLQSLRKWRSRNKEGVREKGGGGDGRTVKRGT